jgi:hypothetical protein
MAFREKELHWEVNGWYRFWFFEIPLKKLNRTSYGSNTVNRWQSLAIGKIIHRVTSDRWPLSAEGSKRQNSIVNQTWRLDRPGRSSNHRIVSSANWRRIPGLNDEIGRNNSGSYVLRLNGKKATKIFFGQAQYSPDPLSQNLWESQWFSSKRMLSSISIFNLWPSYNIFFRYFKPEWEVSARFPGEKLSDCLIQLSGLIGVLRDRVVIFWVRWGLFGRRLGNQASSVSQLQNYIFDGKYHARNKIYNGTWFKIFYLFMTSRNRICGGVDSGFQFPRFPWI